jgi:hypothetical protein
MAPAVVELSPAAAVFLVGCVQHMNQCKILPTDNRAALEASAWLEEIEAKTKAALAVVPCPQCGAEPGGLCQGDPAECRSYGGQG